MTQPIKPSNRPARKQDKDQSQTFSGVMEAASGLHVPPGAAVTTVDVVARSERVSAGYPDPDSCQAPTDCFSKSKRHASIEVIDDEYDTRPTKREDTGDHADKTVSLVEFWQEKYNKMNVRPVEGGQLALETPDGVSRIVETTFDGKFTDTPPLPHEVVAEFLRKHKADCPRAVAWVKAHEASKAYRVFTTRAKVLKKLEDNDDENGEKKPGHALAARFVARQRRTGSRGITIPKSRPVPAQTGSPVDRTARQRGGVNRPSLGPAMDVSAVIDALGDVVKRESAASKASKASEATQDALQGALGEIKKDIKANAPVTDRIDHARGKLENAHKGLLAAIHGDNVPERSSASAKESAPKYPFGGFLSMENEKKFHGNAIEGLDQAQQRFLGNVNAASSDLTPKRAIPENPPPEPLGARRTSAGAEGKGRKRKAHPGDIEHANQAHGKFQEAMFGNEDTSNVQFNDKDF